MLKALLTPAFLCALLCALPGVAAAKTVKLGDSAPAAEITIPDDWEVETADGGFEASADNNYLSGDVVAPADLRGATTETERFLSERKVKLKPETRAQKVVKVAGLTAVETAWEATDPDGPTRVRVDVVKLSETKLLLIVWWRSEEGEKAHGSAVDGILASLKPVK